MSLPIPIPIPIPSIPPLPPLPIPLPAVLPIPLPTLPPIPLPTFLPIPIPSIPPIPTVLSIPPIPTILSIPPIVSILPIPSVLPFSSLTIFIPSASFTLVPVPIPFTPTSLPASSTGIIESISIGTSSGRLFTTTVQISTVAAPLADSSVPANPRDDDSTSTATIVGGIIGVLVALCAVGLIIWFLLRRRRRRITEGRFDFDFDPAHHTNGRNYHDGDENGVGTIHPNTRPGDVVSPEMEQYHESSDYSPWHGNVAHGPVSRGVGGSNAHVSSGLSYASPGTSGAVDVPGRGSLLGSSIPPSGKGSASGSGYGCFGDQYPAGAAAGSKSAKEGRVLGGDALVHKSERETSMAGAPEFPQPANGGTSFSALTAVFTPPGLRNRDGKADIGEMNSPAKGDSDIIHLTSGQIPREQQEALPAYQA